MSDLKKKYRGKKVIFVFGSNLSGIHGKGAAKEAHEKWKAKWGRIGRRGRTGNAYAIPTKDRKERGLKPLPLARIRYYVHQFLYYARKHPDLYFYVTRIGCGLAGYKDKEIAPFFEGAPENVALHFKLDE